MRELHRTGLVDYVLPVPNTGANRRLPRQPGHMPKPLTMRARRKTGAGATWTRSRRGAASSRQLRLHTGRDFTSYKRGTVLRRIERRVG